MLLFLQFIVGPGFLRVLVCCGCELLVYPRFVRSLPNCGGCLMFVCVWRLFAHFCQQTSIPDTYRQQNKDDNYVIIRCTQFIHPDFRLTLIMLCTYIGNRTVRLNFFPLPLFLFLLLPSPPLSLLSLTFSYLLSSLLPSLSFPFHFSLSPPPSPSSIFPPFHPPHLQPRALSPRDASWLRCHTQHLQEQVPPSKGGDGGGITGTDITNVSQTQRR